MQCIEAGNDAGQNSSPCISCHTGVKLIRQTLTVLYYDMKKIKAFEYLEQCGPFQYRLCGPASLAVG